MPVALKQLVKKNREALGAYLPLLNTLTAVYLRYKSLNKLGDITPYLIRIQSRLRMIIVKNGLK